MNNKRNTIHTIVASAFLGPVMRYIKGEFMVAVRGYLRPDTKDDALFMKAENAAREAIENVLMEEEPTAPRKLLQSALEAIRAAKSGDYWPYRSPNPCSTEVALKNAIDQAESRLEAALGLHDSLDSGDGLTSPPSIHIQQLK